MKTNDEMAQVRALIASLLAEKAEILLRIERAAAGIAAALKDLEAPPLWASSTRPTLH